MTYALGLDFGTTNSALAVLNKKQQIKLTEYSFYEKTVPTFRSVLYFSYEKQDEDGNPKASAGPQALENYLEEDGAGRLILSPKSSLASSLFDFTQIQHVRYSLEDLIAIIIGTIKQKAEEQFGKLGSRIVVGRPIHYAGAPQKEDEERALRRMKEALDKCGFHDAIFEYEPIAAAYSYEKELEKDQLVLVADFGGGTTDFCLVRIGPEAKRRGRSKEDILGTSGIPKAGDSFDEKIVNNFFSPHLGLGSYYKSEFNRILPIPSWPYTKLAQWYTVGMLKEPRTLNLLHGLVPRAKEPKKLNQLLDFIYGNLGFYLYRSTESAKVKLSSEEEAFFQFKELPDPVEGVIYKEQFEEWIQKELKQIEECCDGLLEKTGISYAQVDRVFMTGGTSFVPAVREIFKKRFGEAKIGRGNELTSVAQGLAQRASEEWRD